MKQPTDANKTLDWRALVLAGHRLGTVDAVAEAAGVGVKVLAPVGGVSMLHRVYSAIVALPEFASITMIGNTMLLSKHKDFSNLTNIEWINQHQSSPVASVHTYLQSINNEKSTALFVTTGDHALLKSEWVSYFLDESSKHKADIVIGVARFDDSDVKREGRRRTLYKFNDGAYAGCNLYAVLTPHVERLLAFWVEMETSRKRPLRAISLLGWSTLTRYMLGRLSLNDMLQHLSTRLGCRIAYVTMPDQLAATDVDTIDNWKQVCKILEESEDSVG